MPEPGNVAKKVRLKIDLNFSTLPEYSSFLLESGEVYITLHVQTWIEASYPSESVAIRYSNNDIKRQLLALVLHQNS